jgi:hypothetical protein
VYYKNKLYIHGGASFDDMSLFSIPTNDLIVIELDDGCKESFPFCVSNCSKGTYFSDGECLPGPKGSFSDEIGPGECKLCEAGYFSDTIVADNEVSVSLVVWDF